MTTIQELETKLNSLDEDEKIEFLSNYLRTEQRIPLELIAHIYESLANAHARIGNAKGSFYQKAARNWEMAAAINQNQSQKEKRKFLKNALETYRRAQQIYKKQNFRSGYQETKENIRSVRKELNKSANTIRRTTAVLLAVVFLSSFLFLTSPPTGFVVSPLETNGTTIVGAILVLLGIIGTITLLKRWH